MGTFHLPYGNDQVSIELPDSWETAELRPPGQAAAADPLAAVHAALDSAGAASVWERARSAKTAAIAINDKTRPVPHDVLLPPLLRRVHDLGVPREHTILIIATGTPPQMQEDEFARGVPREILGRYRVVCHNGADHAFLVDVGTTPRGTPLQVNREFARADCRASVPPA